MWEEIRCASGPNKPFDSHVPLGYRQDGIHITTCRHTWVQMGEWDRLWGLWRTQIKQDKNKQNKKKWRKLYCLWAWVRTLSEHWNLVWVWPEFLKGYLSSLWETMVWVEPRMVHDIGIGGGRKANCRWTG